MKSIEFLVNFKRLKLNTKAFQNIFQIELLNNAEQIRNYFKMMGPEIKILFDLITSKNYIGELFSRLSKKIEVSKLWSCYWKIYNILRSDKNYTVDFIKIKCGKFFF